MAKPKNEPVKITKAFIDRVQPPAEGYEHHWDINLKGYGLRVTAAGKRVFIAQGRVKGKAVCTTIGPYGEWTEYEAREKARKVLQGMREGTDPRDAKRADEAAKLTLRQVADAYMGRPGKLKDSSKAEIERHVATTFKAWEHKPIADITEDMCLKRFREVHEKGTTGRGKSAPGQANQAFSVLRALINFAMRGYRRADGKPLILFNPVNVLKDHWAPLKPRTDRVPDNKVGAVWNMLKQARANAYTLASWSSIDAIMLMMLTGLRKDETFALTWDRVNLEEGWVHFPDPKNRNPVWLPLSSQAVELLTTRQRIEGNPWVFPSWSESGHIENPRDWWTKIIKIAGTHLSNHSMRRTFITIAATQCGIDLRNAELLTNHVPKGVTERHYLETSHLQWLKPATQKVSDWIEEQAAKASGANVVALRA